MRIAFAGANSTGKTTVLKRLAMLPRARDCAGSFLFSNARGILESMGFQSTATMTRAQLSEFQIAYFRHKRQVECQYDSFITDRSYADVAAYWVIRDTRDRPVEEQEYLVRPCREEVRKYSSVCFFPFGQIPFENDSCRSDDLDFHRMIDSQIKRFLDEWQVNYIAINTADLSERIQLVLKELYSQMKLALR